MTGHAPSPPDPTSPTALRALFRDHDFHPRRSLGQTFLTDANIVAKIIGAARLTGAEPVLEIGPGAGAVTRALVAAARRVVAVEIDAKLVAVLRETVGDAAEVIHADVLAFDCAGLFDSDAEGRWRVVANLPYAITGPAILHLLAAQDRLDGLVIMVQAEVAHRLLAPPGGRARGFLSVLVQAACDAQLVWRVARTCFWPQPRVDSALLSCVVRYPPLVPLALRPAFLKVVRAGFAVRRKTLLNALAHSADMAISKDAARALLTSCDIDGGRRAEDLTVAEFLRLAEAVAAAEEALR